MGTEINSFQNQNLEYWRNCIYSELMNQKIAKIFSVVEKFQFTKLYSLAWPHVALRHFIKCIFSIWWEQLFDFINLSFWRPDDSFMKQIKFFWRQRTDNLDHNKLRGYPNGKKTKFARRGTYTFKCGILSTSAKCIIIQGRFCSKNKRKENWH